MSIYPEGKRPDVDFLSKTRGWLRETVTENSIGMGFPPQDRFVAIGGRN